MKLQKNKLRTHPLTPDQEKWLQASAAQPGVPPQNLRLKLRRDLAPNFSPNSIDPRLYATDQVTLLGLWRVAPNHPRLLAVDQTIREIQRRLEEEPPPTRITAGELAPALNSSPEIVGRALYDMGSLGSFFSMSMGSASDPNLWTEIALQGARAYEDYIQYVGLEELLESLYQSRGTSLDSALAYQTLHSGPLGEHFISSKSLLAEKRQKTAFVMMAMNPKQSDLTDIYKAIQRACNRVGLEAIRIDDIEHAETITTRVLAEIDACSYLIADLSYERPNVYYEIGYAHALGKTPILVRKRETPLHFDLSVHKAPEYGSNAELEEQLVTRLKLIVHEGTGQGT